MLDRRAELRQLAFDWHVQDPPILSSTLNTLSLNFYEPSLARLFNSQISGRIPDGVRYCPIWMREAFGLGNNEIWPHDQSLRENGICLQKKLVYSNEAIKLALFINSRAIGTETKMRSGWYDVRGSTHPAFFLNFLRFSLKHGIFEDLESAVNFLEKSEGPDVLLKNAFVHSGKILFSPEELPPSVPIALIQGRFLGIPHLDHEAAIDAIAQLKGQHTGLKVVVALDHFGANGLSGNDAFRISLLQKIPEIDYFLLVRFPDRVYKIVDSPLFDSPARFMSETEQRDFYEDLFRRIFVGRDRKFLYLNPNYPDKFKAVLQERCQKFGIKPVSRRGGEVWSNSVLCGMEPKAVRSPFNRRHVIGKNDPEEVLLEYWEWLAEHIVETYTADRGRISDLHSKVLFCGSFAER